MNIWNILNSVVELFEKKRKEISYWREMSKMIQFKNLVFHPSYRHFFYYTNTRMWSYKSRFVSIYYFVQCNQFLFPGKCSLMQHEQRETIVISVITFTLAISNQVWHITYSFYLERELGGSVEPLSGRFCLSLMSIYARCEDIGFEQLSKVSVM